MKKSIPFIFSDLRASQQDLLHNPVVQTGPQDYSYDIAHYQATISQFLMHSYFLSTYPILLNNTLYYVAVLFMVAPFHFDSYLLPLSRTPPVDWSTLQIYLPTCGSRTWHHNSGLIILDIGLLSHNTAF